MTATAGGQEVAIVKSLISDDHVPVVMGIGQSSGFWSILPVLTQTKTVGFVTQATLKTKSYPFQPYMFEGNCNYADQAEVALAYTMTHVKIKNLKGVKVGIASITVASGTEWDQNLTTRVEALGGSVVHETLPATLTDASVQVQDLVSNKVAFVLIHHAIAGGIAFLKSADQYGLNVPIATSFGPAQPALYTSTPYNASKNMVVTNCVDPPLRREDAAGQARDRDGDQVRLPVGRVHAEQLDARLDGRADDHHGAEEHQGRLQLGRDQEGARADQEHDDGRLSPNISYSAVCHMGIRSVRALQLQLQDEPARADRLLRAVGAVHHERLRGPGHVRRAARQVAPVTDR